MKKQIAIFIFGLFTSSAFSQKFFVEAGINSSVPAFEGRLMGGPSREARTDLSAHAGIVHTIGNSFRLNQRIGFIAKDFHESFFTGPDNSGTNDYQVSGLQYHLMIEKNLTAKKKLQFLPSVGIYTSFHMGGDLKYQHSTFAGVVKGSRKLNFDKGGDFSRWDAGLTIGTRLQLKKYGLGLLYDLGLVKIDPNSKARWSSFQIVLGYFF